ncbi:MAG: IS630 family transposase [Bacteroidales bacterium]|nr:IS630 family transposase [Bacteroidales bacterium]
MGSKNIEKKLQFTFKKTKLKPGKSPNETTQLNFVSWYESKLKEAKEEKLHILFYDPVHQLHNTINGKCWQKKGGHNTIILESNTGRKLISILGDLNPVNQELTSIVLEGMVDKDVTKAALKNIRDTYNDGKKIIIIMDNAAYNRAYPVQDYAKELKIEIEYLPPYSPNLNLIERVWKFLKSKLKNRYIEKFENFKVWISDFCRNFASYKSEIEKLASNRI